MRIFIALLFLATTTLHAQVGIGTPTPDTKAALDVSSNSKGLLIPRMSTAQRDLIVSPPEGLIIFNSDTKRIEVYNAGSSGEGSLTIGNFSMSIGTPYMNNSWSSSSPRGLAQSFTSDGGLLTAISINVPSVQSQSTSSSYMLTIYGGTPTPTCGYNGSAVTNCTFSSFGAPLATSLVSINRSGINKLYLSAPISLTAGQVYTFSITPTIGTQQFNWDGQATNYTGGNSYGINGNITQTTEDYTFLTHYQVGWRAL